ncbi:hypothetical protein R1flu_012284 [Riccia fluitans]|uniref:Uncharacterized protein n=1 Tax=Riccia fluitans TaxID=41844 RepID=A0ABD1ZA71_9MARC
MLSNDTKNTPSPFVDQKLCKFSQPGWQQAFAIASEAFASASEVIANASDWLTSIGKDSPPQAKFCLHWRTFASEGEGFILGGDPETFWGTKRLPNHLKPTTMI